MAQTNLIHRNANRIALLLDGIEVGGMQSCDASDSYGLEAASGIGDIHVQEYVPTLARHTLTTSQAILYTESLRSVGASLENGDDALRGMIFDITIYDKSGPAGLGAGSSYIRKYVGCSFASGDVDIRKHAIVMSNATFNALDCKGAAI